MKTQLTVEQRLEQVERKLRIAVASLALLGLAALLSAGTDVLQAAPVIKPQDMTVGVLTAEKVVVKDQAEGHGTVVLVPGRLAGVWVSQGKPDLPAAALYADPYHGAVLGLSGKYGDEADGRKRVGHDLAFSAGGKSNDGGAAVQVIDRGNRVYVTQAFALLREAGVAGVPTEAVRGAPSPE